MEGITNRGKGDATLSNGLNESGMVAISSTQAVLERLHKIDEKIGWDVKNEDGKLILSGLKTRYDSLKTNLEGYYKRHAKADLVIQEAKGLYKQRATLMKELSPFEKSQMQSAIKVERARQQMQLNANLNKRKGAKCRPLFLLPDVLWF